MERKKKKEGRIVCSIRKIEMVEVTDGLDSRGLDVG